MCFNFTADPNLKDWVTQPLTDFLLPLTDFIWMLERIFNIFAANLCLSKQINMCIILYKARNQYVTPPPVSIQRFTEGYPRLFYSLPAMLFTEQLNTLYIYKLCDQTGPYGYIWKKPVRSYNYYCFTTFSFSFFLSDLIKQNRFNPGAMPKLE